MIFLKGVININIVSNFNNKTISFLVYLFIINIISFIIIGIDKNKAKKRQWRVPETTFIILGVLGGSTGILMGMVMFKHKLSKRKFYIGIPLILIFNQILKLSILNYIK